MNEPLRLLVAATVLAALLFGGLAQGQESARLGQAQAWLQRGDLKRAQALLQQEIAQNPGHRVQFLFGFLHIQKFDYAAAEDYLREAVNLKPDDAAYRHALAKALLEQGQNRAALEQLDAAISLESRPQYHFARAMCALNMGQLSLAAEALQASLNLNPDQPEALYRLGQIRLDGGDYAQAVAHLRASIESNANQVEAIFALGLAHRHLGDLDAAASRFEQVLLRVPGHVGALFNLGSVLQQLGRRDEAGLVRQRFTRMTAVQDEVEFLKSGVRKNPENLDGRLKLASLQLDLGRVNAAVEQLQAARGISPKHSGIYRLLARAFEAQGDGDRARQAEQFASHLERQGQ